MEAKQLLLEENRSSLTISHLRFSIFIVILCFLLIFGCLFELFNVLNLFIISICLVFVSPV